MTRCRRKARNGTASGDRSDEGVRVSLRQVAWVQATGQAGDGHLHLVSLLPLVEPLGRALTRGVGVERQYDVAGVALEQADMVLGERCPARGHGPRHADLVEPDDVGVPLAHDDLVGVGDVGLRPVEPVQRLRLGVDRRLRRVLVLRRIGRARQHPPTDRHGLAGVGEDREQHAPPEGVLHAVATVGERQAGRPQQLAVDAGTSGQRVPVVRGPAQLERPGDVAAQPARAEVVARRPRRRVIEQRPVVPLDRRAHRLDELLAPCPLTRLASRGVGELHPHLGREVLDGADEVDVLVLLHEREHVARLVAAEALVPARSPHAR